MCVYLAKYLVGLVNNSSSVFQKHNSQRYILALVKFLFSLVRKEGGKTKELNEEHLRNRGLYS